MAKVAFSALVSNLRGKVGGVVFTKGRSGGTVRNRIKPTDPRSSSQSAIRAEFTSAARGFKALSTTNRDLWNAAALGITKTNPVSGQSYSPSGMTYFTGLSTKYLQITPAGTFPLTPPTSAFTGDSITLTAAGGAAKVTFTPTASNGAGIKTELLLQKLKSANRKPTPKGYRTMSFNTTSGTTGIDVTGLTAGTYVPAYRFVKTATGQESGLVILAAVTVT